MLEVLDLMFRLVILAVLLERGLSVLFEHRLFIRAFAGLGLEAVIMLAASVAVCRYGSFDLLEVLFRMDKPSIFGVLASGVFVVGLSKLSTKFFQQVMCIRSAALVEYHGGRLRTLLQSPEPAPLPSRQSEESAETPKPRGAWVTQEIVKQVIQVSGAVIVALVLARLGLD